LETGFVALAAFDFGGARFGAAAFFAALGRTGSPVSQMVPRRAATLIAGRPRPVMDMKGGLASDRGFAGSADVVAVVVDVAVVVLAGAAVVAVVVVPEAVVCVVAAVLTAVGFSAGLP
jgi:hypothetical protein